MHSKGNGGIEIFIKSKQLYLRTLAPEYIEVQDNDGIQLTEIPTEEWIYLGLEFEAKGRGQSTIKVVINNEEP